MPDDNEGVSIEGCTLPGTIRVTRPALELAERFLAAVPAGYIVAFSWHDGERVRASKDSSWVDNGPGMGLGAYRIGQIPEEAIYHSGSFRYAVLIRPEIVDAHPEKIIDLDGPRSVVLR